MTNKFDDLTTELTSAPSSTDSLFGGLSSDSLSLSETDSSSSLTPEKPTEKIFSVSEFSTLLKSVLEGTFGHIKIKGEIQGLKKHSSGTYYFDLKESVAGKDYILNCVLWKWTKIDVKLEEGLEVILSGKITAYTGRSSYQITVESVEVAGIGALLKIIEERKQKLAKEGLFNPEHKKPIPLLPRVIGVVTSPTGAVIQDIIHRITDRFPSRIIVYPTAVQGEGADEQITTAINNFNKVKGINRPDVIIVARGGGSVQDLMPFNEENVVRAVYNSQIPIISAVGHETDTTLIDYVSDLRAPTPTGAAEKAVPVRTELLANITEKANYLTHSILRLYDNFNLKIRSLSAAIKNPIEFITDAFQRLDDKSSKLDYIINVKLSNLDNKLIFTNKMLESYSFKNVLNRGYALVWDNNGQIITNANILQNSPNATIEFANGRTTVYTSAQSASVAHTSAPITANTPIQKTSNLTQQTKPSHKKRDKSSKDSDGLQGSLF